MRTIKSLKIKDDYYQWLCNLIDVEQIGESYWNLTKALYEKDFKWSVPNDDNRAAEGKDLRDRFCTDCGLDYVAYYDGQYFNDDVSMLEVIIALAYRCEAIMADECDEGYSVIDWFWKMMSNARLDTFTDDRFGLEWDDYILDSILEKIINRTYHRNGHGGLFPLGHQSKDQRKVELWYQMNEYLVENYYS